MAACSESSLPGRCEQTTCRSRLGGGWDTAVWFRVAGCWWENFAQLQPALHLVFYHLHCLKNSLSLFQKMGQSWCAVFIPCRCLMDCLCSWMVPGKRRSLGKTYMFVSFVFAQNSVLVQTLPALGFGTLCVGVVNGVSDVMAEQHLNSWSVPEGEDNAYVINCR